jgi:selenide,water dikinase
VPLTRDLLLIGGGHAHALVLRAWGMKPLAGVRVTVINPGPTAPYTGMLPGHIAGHYRREDLEIDLVRLCRHAGARLILGKAGGIDRAARQVMVRGRPPVGYDVASFDLGITARMHLPGFEGHAVGAKPLDVYAARWRDFLGRAVAGRIAPQVAVIGGGVAGCELALAMAHALRQAGLVPQITLIEAGPQVSGLGQGARQKVMAALARYDIDLRVNTRVERIEADQVVLAQSDTVPAALCVGAAGAFAHPWIAASDLPVQDGFIKIGPDLGVMGDARLFAVGDCAHMAAAPRPKAGVFAVRAAPILLGNLRAALGVGKRRSFHPQRHYLKLISLGEKSAMAEKFGQSLSGGVLWRWKDRIDRRFMQKFTDLPVMQMSVPEGPLAAGVSEALAGKPLCGGCGAKVGGGVLQDALGLIAPAQGDVIAGAGDDAAILRQAGGGFQVISTDHLRAIVADPVQMTRISAVHALGDIWAMGAKPQVALASVILPQMTPDLQARSLREITQAARDVMMGAGAQLVGGHTTMGAELTIGFTVTGIRETMPITVGGAQHGDVLLLTRPIGSGVIMAADMQGDAAGRDVAAALAVMQEPQDRAAKILAQAHAMTDVTGFGLAGHVQAICRASGLGAELWQDKIPLYAGARGLSDAGVASSLMAANLRDAPVSGKDDPLLHDPQTAGGLLAALPEAAARVALQNLQGQGLSAAIIGRLGKDVGGIVLR